MRTRRRAVRSFQDAGRLVLPQSPAGSVGACLAEPPADFAAFCSLIQDLKSRLPRRLTEVARFLMANPDDVAFEPVARLAGKADMSSSAFVRLAQHLGFKGFSELQAIFERRLLDVRSETDESDALKRTAISMARAIERFAAQTDRSMFNRAVELIREARTVFVVAQLDDSQAVLAIRNALMVAGIRTMPAGGSFGLIDETIAFASMHDAVIVVDLPPYDRDLAPRVARLRLRAVPLLLVTDSCMHPLITDEMVFFEIRDPDRLGLTHASALSCLAGAIAGEVQQTIDLSEAGLNEKPFLTQ